MTLALGGFWARHLERIISVVKRAMRAFRETEIA